MTIEQIVVHLPADIVWKMLSNPQHLVNGIEDVVKFNIQSDTAFSLTVNVDTGVGRARYDFRCRQERVEERHILRLVAVGTNAHNIVEFTSDVVLQPVGDSSTTLHCQIDTKVRGGLASVAQRTVNNIIVRHVRGWLNNVVQSRTEVPIQ